MTTKPTADIEERARELAVTMFESITSCDCKDCRETATPELADTLVAALRDERSKALRDALDLWNATANDVLFGQKLRAEAEKP